MATLVKQAWSQGEVQAYVHQLRENPIGLVWPLLGAYATYLVFIAIYNLTLHPLAKFPGPFFCRISGLPQLYYEAILNGKFMPEIDKYHEKYGPVVRINPNELHIKDSSMYHAVYKNNAFTKDSYALGASQALAFTVSIEQHKAKRKTLNPCFSKSSINNMEEKLYEELDLVFAKIREYERKGEEVPIAELLYCYTGDIISTQFLGKNLDLISAPNFVERSKEMQTFTKGIWMAVHFSVLRYTLVALPRWMLAFISGTFVDVIWFVERLAQAAIKSFNLEDGLQKKAYEETIFDRMLCDNARREEKGQKPRPLTFRELADEGYGILNAGTEPTAIKLCHATFFFHRFPHVQKPLMDELATVELKDGRLPLLKLESLPYFTGFIKESLRYLPLVPGRLPRVVPKGGLYIPSVNKTVPEGFVVGLSQIHVNFDPEVFPDPYEFRPERWFADAGEDLDKWVLAFSKGRTDCIGKTLAWAEMYLILANLFTTFEMELAPGSIEGMEWEDRVVIQAKKNLRVLVKSRKA
ncbi:cytochrome P450 [Trichoderma sp. SZMC 28014]